MKIVTDSLDERDLKAIEPDTKVGLLASLNAEGLPHITLITTLMAKSPVRLVWGQFCEGLSKTNVQKNPKTGFLVMTMDRSLWRGTAVWTGLAREGEDYAMFNNRPMFRYNAYTGIHTVHYMDLVRTWGRESLPLGKIAASTLLSALAGKMAGGGGPRVLNAWTAGLLNRLDTLKFAAYVGQGGYPCIVPVFSCRTPDGARLVFSPLAYAEELFEIKPGQSVAVYVMSLQMESVLMRGVFRGFGRYCGVTLGTLDIDWVYNSMPPVPGQIYPEVDLKPVEDFS